MASRPLPYDPVREAARENAASAATAPAPRLLLSTSFTPVNRSTRAGSHLATTANTNTTRSLPTLAPRPVGMNPSINTTGSGLNGPFAPRRTVPNSSAPTNSLGSNIVTAPSSTTINSSASTNNGGSGAHAPRPAGGSTSIVNRNARLGGATSMDEALANIASRMSHRLSPHEKDCALALHRYMLSVDTDADGTPIVHRTGVREFRALHRAVRNAQYPYQHTGVCSSITGVIHAASGLVNREHTPSDTQVDSRFTAQELVLTDAEFRWFAIPKAHNPFQSGSMRGRRAGRTRSTLVPRVVQPPLGSRRLVPTPAADTVIDLTSNDSGEDADNEREDNDEASEEASSEEPDNGDTDYQATDADEDEASAASPAPKRRRVR